MSTGIYIEIEAAQRFVFTENQIRYAGDLIDNRHITLVSYICNFTDSSNF